MEELSYRVRISALWLFGMVAFIAYRTIAASEGATEVSVLSNSELATVLVIMMVFAFLSLLLRNRINRLMNLIAGGVFLVLELIMLGDGLTAYPSAAFNLMTAAFVVFMAAIVWFATRWPKQQVQSP
jgi:predicted membrane channel-forming protein YqfA (hemolysin III family)